MPLIQLTRGMVTVVDDEDYEWASGIRWCASEGRYGCFYASHAVRERRLDGTFRTYSRQLQRWLLDPERKLPRNIKVDHINGDTLDNRRCNLRLCSDSESNANRRMYKKRGVQFKGVWFNPKGAPQSAYWVSAKLNGKQYWGKRQPDPISAAREYNRLALLLHGEFARLNVIPGDAQ
jgi:hypothetical protein